jgi:hypothetical protein
MNWAPPLRRRKLTPRHEVGAYESFKKLASDAYYLLPGLPDFCWYVIPKAEKCTKSTQNVPNGHKISQMCLKYSKWP